MTPSREGLADADATPAKQQAVRQTPAWQRICAAILHLPAAVFAFFFQPSPTSHSRRALLQGRLWKLTSPSQTQSQLPSLVTRLPQPYTAAVPAQQPRSIGGINIDPVPPTNFGQRQISRTLPVHRPPGAIDEFQFLAGCTRCGDCIAACPYDAIVKAPARLGAIAGTPVIEADTSACMLCEDFPCITACEPGVLVASIPPIMGTARVTEHLCLAHHHTICTVCSERCPVDGAIIVTAGKPEIDELICTGCGVCRYVCPAPENAILLMPAFSRPGLPPT